ncbi:hypothetical protein Kfla_2062 [Kribbella flavida DSM 17836]|uniref:Uncharacterized protein n=1 Tax=Kribbella flavida (strain DSM 17836 / JCM 10339 / NBRC 14399) TaxID=479435 RepID=D2PS23_KRIFD|nr:hypothetical protein [Kribbella flavida]ADB31147.1 hypothetical protein Kfla_2062 [Kribbella flavida DSM 17836]
MVLVFLVTVAVVLLSPVVIVWTFVGTVFALVRRRRAWRIVALRRLATLSAAFAVGSHALGVALVMLEVSQSTHGADSSPSHACRNAAPDPGSIRRITRHEAGYLPPRFDCVMDDGTKYSGRVVPAGLGPVVLVSGAGAIVLGLAARRTSRQAADVASA